MEKELIFYPDFDHPASQLSAFSLCIDVFIISLKNGDIVRFKPDEIAHFKEWLYRFEVRDIALNDGVPSEYLKPDLPEPPHGFFKRIKLNKRK
ncbi:hypothetical protein GCM10009120_50730 [Sphingobacterium siyangense subsp. cladoniae]|uniref:hypothetical protein n=1 Tax=Sphingobacterium siyangense TaxID=459529 RepID=UPI0031F946C0